MIFQIKITLQGSKPPIWRRIEVDSNTLLADFHKIIQSTMGWMNGHLHQFAVGRSYYGPPSEWDDMAEDYTKMKIKDFLSAEGDKIQYDYDFGDSWAHTILLEEIKVKEKGAKYPRCVKGKRACPPEDCGGIWGYMELIEIMKDKKHESYEDMYEWLGGELAPEAFDIDEINEKLSSDNFGVFSYDLF